MSLINETLLWVRIMIGNQVTFNPLFMSLNNETAATSVAIGEQWIFQSSFYESIY